MRIFVTPLVAGPIAVRGDEHHYLGRVRRARVGDAVELVDGEGHRAQAVIESITEAETMLRVSAVEEIADLPPHVRVLLPLIKGDRMDTCLEKLVEVGVDSIVLWPAARAVVRLDDDRRDARLAKFRAALQAGARQCGRASIPAISYAPSLTSALSSLPAVPALRFVLDPSADRAALPASAIDVTLVSGPEGGLTPAELDTLAAASFTPLGLGPRVLRAETAPVVATALVRAATQT